MHFAWHQVRQAIIHEAMALDPRQALEGRAYQAQSEMTAAIACTVMSGMQPALVDEVQLERPQRRQQAPDPFDQGFIHR